MAYQNSKSNPYKLTNQILVVLGIWTILGPLGFLVFRLIMAAHGGDNVTFGYSAGSERFAAAVTILTTVALVALSIGESAFKALAGGSPYRITHALTVRYSKAVLLTYTPVLLYWLVFTKHGKSTEYDPPIDVFVLALLAALFTPSTEVPRGVAVENTSTSEPRRDPGRASVPKLKMEDIFGNSDLKSRLLKAAKEITGGFGSQRNRNGILLYGEPGNGKTAFAEALAGELKLPFLQATVADVKSKWMGETALQIRNLFNQARAQAPCVLFLDEVDSLLASRDSLDQTSGGSSAQDRIESVNEMLTQLVEIRKSNVVVIAATNYLDKLDSAAIREGRFDFKVEIAAPDEAGRVGLLSSGLRTNTPRLLVNQDVLESVAQRWTGFSAKRILAVTEELPAYLEDEANKGNAITELQFDHFMAALRRIQGSKGAAPENVTPLSQLILTQATRDALEMIASRLRDPLRVERLGGSLPTGVLFFGPAGTGKTTVAKALAKESGLAFLTATGTDLAKNPAALEKLHNRAKELRPAMIFIDEADDLVRSREFSANTESTNKLLTLMDGVSDKVRDVIWVAATNHPDQIDAALLRGGRFTEKVEFVKPSENQLLDHMQGWLDKRQVTLEPGVTIQLVADRMGEQSIANADEILQYAVNRAISKTSGDHVVLSLEDIRVGIGAVSGWRD